MNNDVIYSPADIGRIMRNVKDHAHLVTGKKKTYYNIPASFDIETSSFYDHGNKCACMYEWTFGICGYIIIGRTWSEYEYVINTVVKYLHTDVKTRLIVGVHNLSYEFQFIRSHFKWSTVFSTDTRKPIYALTTNGIEYRCTYLLSGYSLSRLAQNLNTFNMEKKTGDLDYSLIRTSATPLTDREIGYCVYDVKIVLAYLIEQIEQYQNIAKLPLTKTGKVRDYCRSICFGESDEKNYKRMDYNTIIHNMNLTVDTYDMLKRAFQGGFTHANAFYTDRVLDNVTSYDFTSSYPAVMVAEQYPISSPEYVEIADRAELDRNMILYCCIFDIELWGVCSTVFTETYISRSKCYDVQNAQLNNGRVVRADHLRMTITEQDFFILEKMYEWKHIRITNFYRFKKGYLPTDFIKAILKLYSDKTVLKGVKGKEIEYLNAKEMLNSCYGMSVTDICRPEYVYDDKWKAPIIPDPAETIAKYNDNKGRFLYYPWGVWVTAYARRNLFSGILSCGSDYIYSDTDSIKILNADKHKQYIDNYNKDITYKLELACDYHGIPYEYIRPKTIKGEEKPLGIWDFDGFYDRFKTLGAKRYMVDHNGNINITVAGLNKTVCVPYLINKYGDAVFDHFTTDLYIPPEHTGKNTHTYIDDVRTGRVMDYMGIEQCYHELTSVHLEPSDYSLSIAQEYYQYIHHIQFNYE